MPDPLRPSRYTAFGVCLILLALWAVLVGRHPFAWTGVVLFGALSLVGVHDLLQRRHAILRNYPVIGHIRWMAELVRPEIRQYLIEADEDAAPFSRSQRSIVYQRAKGTPASSRSAPC